MLSLLPTLDWTLYVTFCSNNLTLPPPGLCLILSKLPTLDLTWLFLDDVDEDDDMTDDTGERGEVAGREGEEGLQLNAMFCRIYIKETFCSPKESL